MDEKNIYKIIIDIKNDVGEIKGVLKGLPCVEHSSRLNEVEKNVDQIVGKSAILGSIFGFVGAVILTLIGLFLKQK